VTPPLLFVHDLAGVVVGDRVALPVQEARHAAAALRITDGEVLFIADGQGHRASGQAVVEGNNVSVDVTNVEVLSRPNPTITVVQALAKGEHGELAIDLMTQVGVDRIIPWSASRSIVQWKGDRADKSLAKWQLAAKAATKQSRQAWTPEISTVMSTKEVLALLPNFNATYVLHETAANPLAAAKLPATGEICLIVGPEGGISDEEVAAFEDVGAQVASLGDSVLRASLAGAMGIGVLSTRLRWALSNARNMEG
jgi:16S rRNA (uracil1498-N3)-methyltransferase